jgi:hypothetical protein
LLLLVITLAAFLRYFQVEAKALWFDESVEFWTSVNPLNRLLSDVTTTYQPPLYNLMLHFWAMLGSSEVWLRSLSIIFDIFGLIGAYLLLTRLFKNPLVGILVALFLAVSPALIRYSQEVGEYSLVVACLQWFLFFGIRAIKSNYWKDWLWPSLIAGMAFYTHYGAIILIFSFYLGGLIYSLIRRDGRLFLKLTCSGLFFLMLCLPLFPMLVQQAGRQGSSHIMQFAGIKKLVYSLLSSFVKTFSFSITGYPFSKIHPWFSYVIIILFAVISFSAIFSKNHQLKYLFFFFSLSYGFYFLLVSSGAYAYGGFGFRYMLVLVPAFCVLLGLAVYQLEQVPNRFSRCLIESVLFVYLVGLCLFSLPNRFVSLKVRGSLGWPEVEQMTEVYDYWLSHKSEDSHTYVYYGAVPTFGYYQYQNNNLSLEDFPAGWVNKCWSSRNYEYCNDNNIHYGNWFRQSSLEEKYQTIQAVIPKNADDVWLVFSHTYGSEMEDILTFFRNYGYGLVETYNKEGALLFHIEK